MKLKQDQAGFSLIEVVLSMAILAIISIPLLSYFTDSMKYNAKMAQQQHATALAQETLEALKNEDKLVKDPGAGYTIPFLTDKGYVLDGATNTMGATGFGSADFYGDGSAIGEDYDVVVHVKTDTTESTTPIPEILASDDEKDVLATESGQKQEALVQFKAVNAKAVSQGLATKLDSSDIESRMQRKITVAVSKDGAYEKAVVGCSYTCGGLRGAGTSDTYTCTDLAEERLTEIRRVYILYYVGNSDDELTVSVDAGMHIPALMLICQNTSALTDAYRIAVSATTMPEISANIGMDGRKGTVTNAASGLALSNVKSIVEDKEGIRKVDLTVSVYAKGEAHTAGATPYITVNAAKGE